MLRARKKESGHINDIMNGKKYNLHFLRKKRHFCEACLWLKLTYVYNFNRLLLLYITVLNCSHFHLSNSTSIFYSVTYFPFYCIVRFYNMACWLSVENLFSKNSMRDGRTVCKRSYNKHELLLLFCYLF